MNTLTITGPNRAANTALANTLAVYLAGEGYAVTIQDSGRSTTITNGSTIGQPIAIRTRTISQEEGPCESK